MLSDRYPSDPDAGMPAAEPPVEAQAAADAGRRVRTLVFSHANSFPAGTYRALFAQWEAAGLRVCAVEKFGHDPRYPVTRGWPHLGRQLEDFIAREVAEPCWLVGHSLGGYLSLLAAMHQPQWVLGIVLLDSPLVHGPRAALLTAAQRAGLMHRIMPSGVSAQRRHLWDSLEQVREHFGAKRKFARWDPAVLADYVQHGTQPHPQGRTLAFRREVETDIYNAIHTGLPAALRRRPLHCPVAFIAGRSSRELQRVGLAATLKLVRGRLSWMEGSHLYPFERPHDTAAEVLRWLDEFEQGLAAGAAAPARRLQQ
ncbi:MAG: alpha/beta fold hydrolase [Pseudomonadota bacterium]